MRINTSSLPFIDELREAQALCRPIQQELHELNLAMRRRIAELYAQCEKVNAKIVASYEDLLEALTGLKSSNWPSLSVSNDELSAKHGNLRLLLALHQDLALLYEIGGDTESAMVRDIRNLHLELANAETFRHTSGRCVGEVTYNFHRVFSSIVRDPKHFVQEIEKVKEEVEQRALDHWEEAEKDGVSPEKALLLGLLWYWQIKLEDFKRDNRDAGLITTSINEAICARHLMANEELELRLAVCRKDGRRLGRAREVRVGGETSSLKPLNGDCWRTDFQDEERWRIRCIPEDLGPRVERLVFRARQGSPALGNSTFINVNLNDTVVSYRLEIRRGGVRSIHDDPPEKWLQEKLGALSNCDDAMSIFTVTGGRIGPVELFPEKLKSQLEDRKCDVEVITAAGLEPWKGKKINAKVCLIVAESVEYAEALRMRLRKDHPAIATWDAHIGGYLRDRIPGLLLEIDALNLVEEYLAPLRPGHEGKDEEVMKAFFATLDQRLREAGSLQLTSRAVEEAYDQCEGIRDYARKMLKDFEHREKSALQALYNAMNPARIEAHRGRNRFVDVDEILEANGVSSGESMFRLGETLQQLHSSYGVLDRDGEFLHRYRFSNQSYYDLVEEFFG